MGLPRFAAGVQPVAVVEEPCRGVSLPMFEFFKKTDVDFIGKRIFFFMFSGLLVLCGMVALIQVARGRANLGIDFAGGAAVQLKFETAVRIDGMRAVLEANGLKDAEIQEVMGDARFLVRFKKEGVVKADISGRIEDILSKAYPQNRLVVESSTEIGPTVGRKLQKDALLAVALSMMGIIIYIAFRFEFRFGVAAALATFHDVLVILGIFFIMNKELTLLVVTALLTVAGYSLSDTVVVFDRIRENMRFRKKESFGQIINKAINEVLSRTFNTSMTTFLALVSLFFLGGEVIHDFALAMIFGVVVGTYSSWFIASPLLLLWEGRERTHQ